MVPRDANQRRLAHLTRFRSDARPAPLDPARFRAAIEASGRVPVCAQLVPWVEFDAYVGRADYAGRFPGYVKEFGTGAVFLGKALEHFLSFALLAPTAGEVIMDVAASNSPCADLLARDFGVTQAYRQDLNYPAGVNELKVGSPASMIPLPDASLHSIMLHNSWEHFEGDEDLAFLFEVKRLLKPGGRMLIVPLFVKDRLEIWTSPTVWHNKYSAVAQTPSFDPRATIVVREDVKQRQAKFFDAPTLLADLAQVPGLGFALLHFTNGSEREYGFPFALIATREA